MGIDDTHTLRSWVEGRVGDERSGIRNASFEHLIMRKIRYDGGKHGMACLGAGDVLAIVISRLPETNHFHIISIGRRRMIGNCDLTFPQMINPYIFG
jgi:hypothetical protein